MASKGKEKAGKKEVVGLLCKMLREESVEKTSKNGLTQISKHLVYECPKLQCTLHKREISFGKKA
jgi:hypothetical protein